jgi:hypothetical protein
MPGLLRTCKQLRAEGVKIFYEDNDFNLNLGYRARPQNHWINEAARTPEKKIVTRMEGQNLEVIREWLRAFYNGRTVITWNPRQPHIELSSKASVKDALRHGFDAAYILQKQRRERHVQGPTEEEWQHSAEVLLDMWLQTARTPFKLRGMFRGREGGKKYRDVMALLERHHHNPNRPILRSYSQKMSNLQQAFSMVEIMHHLEWKTVRRLLQCWFRTWCTEATERRAARSITTT